MPGATDWDAVAPWYDELVGFEGSEYHQQVVLPGIAKLIDPKPGLRVLDVACGQGVLCRLFASRGASMTGLDASRKLIDSARQRGQETITYLCGDARELMKVQSLEAGSFDAVTLVLAVQNIHPLGPLFEGMAAMLKPGGCVAIVMMHPAFRGPKSTSWGWVDQSVQYRRVDRYLMFRKEPIISHPGKKDGTYTWTFHRPIETYINALAKAGLVTDAMHEWPSHKVSQPGPRAKAENTARKEIPLFLALRARKL
ncbi:MAG: methyltransferase domain-containing protein [Planctomycetes bacterium]|nr:methyltransferase domain-containing protein [Planctomycetota bacterium]